MADWTTGAVNGATIGTMLAPGVGTAIGAGAGLLLGGLSDWSHSKNVANAKKDIDNWQTAANKILEDSYNSSVKLSGDGDVESYKTLRDSYDPSQYVLSDELLNSFDKSNYNVADYLNPNAQAIREDVAKTLQHTAAGSAMGHSSGAALSIMQGVMEKDEQLLKDAREQMNQERSFDYGMYQDFIANKQKQLDTLQQGNMNQMNMLRSDIQFDQQNKDNYVSNQLNLGNAVMQSKAALV